jgi:cytochrome c556
MRSGSISGAALAGVALASWATAAYGQSDAVKADEGTLKYRQSLMETIGGDMASLSNMMKYGILLPSAAQVHADGLASHANLIATAFERRVTAGPTDAQPAIWEKPDEFRQSVEKFEAETARLSEVAKGGDLAALGAQLKATGKACGSCHETFRKPKEESFHRQGGGH